MDAVTSAEVRKRLLNIPTLQVGNHDEPYDTLSEADLRGKVAGSRTVEENRSRPEPKPGGSTDLPEPSEPLQSVSSQSDSPVDNFPYGYEEKKVYEDNVLVAFIKREHFKRQKIFALDDAHYGIKFQYASDLAKSKYPTIMSLLGAFRLCLGSILKEVCTFYEKLDATEKDPEAFHRQMYLTLASSSLMNTPISRIERFHKT